MSNATGKAAEAFRAAERKANESREGTGRLPEGLAGKEKGEETKGASGLCQEACGILF